MRARLRVGDRVRTITESWGDEYVPVGAVGTVVNAERLAVCFHHDPTGDGTGRWAMLRRQVVPVARTPWGRAWYRHLDRGYLTFSRDLWRRFT